MIVGAFRARVRPGFEADLMEQRRAGDQDGLLGDLTRQQWASGEDS